MRQNAASRDTIRVFKSYQPGKAAVLANKAHSLSHTKWMCKYHIVFTPKYRRKLIYSQYRDSLGEIFRNLCRYKGVEIIEGHLDRVPNVGVSVVSPNARRTAIA